MLSPPAVSAAVAGAIVGDSTLLWFGRRLVQFQVFRWRSAVRTGSLATDPPPETVAGARSLQIRYTLATHSLMHHTHSHTHHSHSSFTRPYTLLLLTSTFLSLLHAPKSVIATSAQVCTIFRLSANHKAEADKVEAVIDKCRGLKAAVETSGGVAVYAGRAIFAAMHSEQVSHPPRYRAKPRSALANFVRLLSPRLLQHQFDWSRLQPSTTLPTRSASTIAVAAHSP